MSVQPDAGEMDAGELRFHKVLTMIGGPDPRDDIDTASLVRRFPRLADVTVSDVSIAGPHGDVPGRTYRPELSFGAGLVWIHGGAFVAGSLDMPESHWVGLELASRGIAVLALDYRKALHGVHHPVLSDDVLAGWSAAMADDDLLGVPSSRVHLGGASAGANLAAGIAVRLRAAGSLLPRSLILVYPVLHFELPAAADGAAAAAAGLPDELRFTPDFIRAINRNYLGDSGDRASAFPGEGDVSGLPPTFVLNAEADDLRASGEAHAAQVAVQGGSVEVTFEPGTRHGYLDLPGDAGATASLDRIAEWIRGRSEG